MHKFSRLVGLEKLVQVKSEFFDIIICKLYALSYFVANNVGHLIGEKGQPRQIGIRILHFAGNIPVALLSLLVGIRPIVDGTLREFVICQRLKRCAGKMQRPLAADMVESGIRLISIHALMGFIYNKDIPRYPLLRTDFRQLIVLPAEIYGPFQILQADKFNASPGILIQLCNVFLPVADKLPVLDSIHIANKDIAGLGAKKCLIILIPGIGNGRAVRHDENILCAELHAQIIGG